MARTDSGYNSPYDLIQYGPTIDVQVGYDPDYLPSPGRRAQLPPGQWMALVDTGAAESAIDAELDFTIDGPFDSANLTNSGRPYYALIGRTFLRHFNMAYNGRTGSVIISND